MAPTNIMAHLIVFFKCDCFKSVNKTFTLFNTTLTDAWQHLCPQTHVKDGLYWFKTTFSSFAGSPLSVFLSFLRAGLIDPARSSVSWAGVLAMVCCVSRGSGDSSNVGVIYRPLNKQASLPQPVNVGPNDCSESGVWGTSAALK